MWRVKGRSTVNRREKQIRTETWDTFEQEWSSTDQLRTTNTFLWGLSEWVKYNANVRDINRHLSILHCTIRARTSSSVFPEILMVDAFEQQTLDYKLAKIK